MERNCKKKKKKFFEVLKKKISVFIYLLCCTRIAIGMTMITSPNILLQNELILYLISNQYQYLNNSLFNYYCLSGIVIDLLVYSEPTCAI